MSVLKFLNVNKKRIIGTSLLLSLSAVQSVGAATTVSDSIVSKGNIEYDADSNGTADVYFHSADLTTLATGIDSLNTNVATLQQSYTDLTTQTTKYKSDIIAGLNNNLCSKDNIAADASFADIISRINNVSAPTSAIGNTVGGGTNAGLGLNGASGVDVNIDGVSELNLGVDESITLPSGYYPNPITVKNNVANRGSAQVVLDKNKKTATLSSGYYDAVNVSTTLNPTGSIVYHIGHVHTGSSSAYGGCYTVKHGSQRTVTCSGYSAREDWGGWYDEDGDGVATQHHFWIYDCPHGQSAYGDGPTSYVSVTHTVNDVYYSLGCGLSEGQHTRDTSDISTLTANEKIISATITY